jgi:cytochrome b561
MIQRKLCALLMELSNEGAKMGHCDQFAHPNATAQACAGTQTGHDLVRLRSLCSLPGNILMRSKVERYHSIFILNQKALAFLIFVSLGLGWYANHTPEINKQIREFVLDIHTSIGIIVAVLLLLQILIFLLTRKYKPDIDEIPRWNTRLAYSLYYLIYVSLILLLVSGYLQAIFRGATVEFWGLRLPAWDVVDRPIADLFGKFWGAPFRIWGATNVTSAAFFGALHGLLAFVLAGLLFAYIGIAAINRIRPPRRAAPLLPVSMQPQADAGDTTPPITSNVVRGLAKNLRLFGWIEFWLQAVLAVFTALLLEFATSGRAFSPGASGFGDAIYWGADGFILLLLAICLAFSYTRVARKIASRPDSYLNQGGFIAFWFLLAGILTGLLGILFSFVGVALSISLLIAKTVSQPPGIAINDPSKIIRALDIFILLVNCNLLIAHIIGAGVALWLGLSVLSSRLKYITTARRLDGSI